jgi:hypothetical protein
LSATPAPTSSFPDARLSSMEFLRGDVERAIVAFQSRISGALNVPYARDLVMDCVELGVPSHVLEALLCSTLARYELIPRRIEVMVSASPNSARALRYLAWIDGVLAETNRNAGQTEAVFGFEDPTRVPDEVLSSLTIVTGHFKNAPAAERKLRAKLGIQLKRLKMKQRVAERAAIGYLSFAMQGRFRDGAPHDRLVADLVNAALSAGVDFTDVQHCRAAYVKLQAFR